MKSRNIAYYAWNSWNQQTIWDMDSGETIAVVTFDELQEWRKKYPNMIQKAEYFA